MFQHRHLRNSMMFSLMLLTGCASHSNDAKLEADMVILTQKMQALNAELIVLKAKQTKEQQLKTEQQAKNKQGKLNSTNQS